MSGTKLGHAHIFVRDVETSKKFYSEVLGLRVTESEHGRWAFLSSGDAHHELALSQVGADAPGPVDGGVGLFHLGFDAADKSDFARIIQRLLDHHVDIDPVDHRISWGVYFSDPDGNRLEVCLDTRDEPDGTDLWEGRNRPLPVERVLSALDDEASAAP